MSATMLDLQHLTKVIVVLQQRMEVIETGELVWQDVELVELGED